MIFALTNRVLWLLFYIYFIVKNNPDFFKISFKTFALSHIERICINFKSVSQMPVVFFIFFSFFLSFPYWTNHISSCHHVISPQLEKLVNWASSLCPDFLCAFLFLTLFFFCFVYLKIHLASNSCFLWVFWLICCYRCNA